MREDEQNRQSPMTSSRMEAFSDGVIAVIVTIMVLELHVPHQNGWAGFITVLPMLFIYVLSFFIVGIYWVNHHELLRRCESIDSHVLWSNLVFLLMLSFLPFSTDYVGEKHFDSFSAGLYTLALLLAGLAFFGLRHTIGRMQAQMGTLSLQHRIEARKHVASLALYLVALPVALFSPLISLGLDTLVTLLWILPALGTRRTLEHLQHRSNEAEPQRDTL